MPAMNTTSSAAETMATNRGPKPTTSSTPRAISMNGSPAPTSGTAHSGSAW
jgi:hypothetical protein